MLMSLPWSDVFTTNYDTLLEDTHVSERKYELICTPADIPEKMRPRIIKLHGSFPSHRPFIITREHYRTYPRKFAPFVNMVQQSIMENVFCLLGFSGDDPNFLNWIGWVQDNLGSNMPRIYLCGLQDNLTSAKRKVLEKKSIIPIDLSPAFPKGQPNRHLNALGSFLKSLQAYELNGSKMNLHWPNQPPSAEDQYPDFKQLTYQRKHHFSGPGPARPPVDPSFLKFWK